MKRIISVALALVMVFALALSVGAKDSPTVKEYYKITTATDPADGSLGTAASSKNKVDIEATGEDAQVVLTATPTKGAFIKWTIEGEYDIVSGSVNDKVLTIIPKSDIHAIAVFRASASSSSSTTSSSGSSSTSPKTGDPLFMIIGLAVLALGAGALAVKKIKEK